jgi:uncharacterized membrane protein
MNFIESFLAGFIIINFISMFVNAYRISKNSSEDEIRDKIVMDIGVAYAYMIWSIIYAIPVWILSNAVRYVFNF